MIICLYEQATMPIFNCLWSYCANQSEGTHCMRQILFWLPESITKCQQFRLQHTASCKKTGSPFHYWFFFVFLFPLCMTKFNFGVSAWWKYEIHEIGEESAPSDISPYQTCVWQLCRAHTYSKHNLNLTGFCSHCLRLQKSGVTDGRDTGVILHT